jgi:hypothetical protein
VTDNNELMARGKELVDSGRYRPPRGRYLGRIELWGLDVYEGSPAEWRRVLVAEHRGSVAC